jgi:hypothetical protein
VLAPSISWHARFVQRREFLVTSAVIGAACRAQCGVDAEVTALAQALRARFDGVMNVPTDVFERFAADHVRHAGLPKRVTDSVARRFVMSTDLLQHGDESRALTYVAYYDPYVSTCYNPLRTAAEPG